jgi:hypothetical protein
MEPLELLPMLVFPHDLERREVEELDVVKGGVLELGDLFI